MIKPREAPSDADRQALRIRRLTMATAASALAVAVFFAAHRVGLLDRDALIFATFATAGFVAGFHVIFRTGLNLRFRDPSLTEPQIAAAAVVILFVASRAREGHGVLGLLFMMPVLFGVFRLTTRQLLGLTAFVSASYLLVVVLYWGFQAHTAPDSFRLKLLNWFVLTVVLAFFSVMGGHVSRLRKHLVASNASLAAALLRIESLASRDDLTGVLNRRSLLDRLAQQRSRAERFDGVFSVLMIDIDHFKRINDTYGHAGGDEILKRFANAAGAVLRDVDAFGRYGGEEFMAILPQTDVQEARLLAERLRRAVEALLVPVGNTSVRVTISTGIASYPSPDVASPDDLIREADRALYRAKQDGRNRAVKFRAAAA